MNRLFDLEQEVIRVRHRGQRSHQASMQLAIEKAYVTKTDKGGAYLHPITTNNAGNITAVKSIQVKDANRTRVPTGAELSVDTAKTGQKSNETYVWAQYKNKTGAIRESSIVVPPSAAVKAIVVKQDAELQRVVTGATPESFLPQSGVLKKLPLGTRVLVQPRVIQQNFVWTMHNGTVGALKQTEFVRIPTRLTFDSIWASPGFRQFFRAHLATEFSAENLDFLEEVKDITTPQDANDVYDRFVPETLTRPININYQERQRLQGLRSRNQLSKLEFGLNDTGQWANQPISKQVSAPMGPGGGGGGLNALLASSGNTRACVQIFRLLQSDSMNRFKTKYGLT